MAFSVKQIKAILSEKGLPVESLDACAEEICSRHTADLDGIKEERDSFKQAAETLADVQKELNELKASVERDGKDPFKVKYEALREEFNGYKADIAAKEMTAKKTAVYRELLKEARIREKRRDAILRVTDVDSKIEFDENGEVKSKAELIQDIRDEWSDFVDTDIVVGTVTPTPPTNNGGGLTREKILEIKDTAERQKAIAANINLFQGGTK